jgi:hypothetical protein
MVLPYLKGFYNKVVVLITIKDKFLIPMINELLD